MLGWSRKTEAVPVAQETRLAVCDGLVDITVRHDRGAVIAAITGDIDISTADGLRQHLFKLADTGQTLIVDLNRVTFIDSAGLGALIGAYRRAATRGGTLHAVCSRPQIRRLLWLTGVDRRIPLTATVDGALMSLGVPPDGDGPGKRLPDGLGLRSAIEQDAGVWQE